MNNIEIKRLVFITLGIVVSVSIYELFSDLTFGGLLVFCSLVTALSTVLLPRANETFASRLLIVIFGGWIAVVHQLYSTNYFARWWNETDHIMTFIFATMAIALGALVFTLFSRMLLTK